MYIALKYRKRDKFPRMPCDNILGKKISTGMLNIIARRPNHHIFNDKIEAQVPIRKHHARSLCSKFLFISRLLIKQINKKIINNDKNNNMVPPLFVFSTLKYDKYKKLGKKSEKNEIAIL